MYGPTEHTYAAHPIHTPHTHVTHPIHTPHAPPPIHQVEHFLQTMRNQPSAAQAAQVLAAQRAMRAAFNAEQDPGNGDDDDTHSDDSDVTVVGELSLEERLAVWVLWLCFCCGCVFVVGMGVVVVFLLWVWVLWVCFCCGCVSRVMD